MDKNITSSSENVGVQTGDFNIQKLLGVFIESYPVFIVSIILLIIGANIYLRYSTAIYTVTAQVMVQDDKKGNVMMENSVMEEFGIRSKSSVDNEAEVFKTRTLLKRVVEELDLNVKFFTQGRLKSIEIPFQELPFVFNVLHFNADSLRVMHSPIVCKFRNGEDAYLAIEGRDHIPFKIGDTITLPTGRVSIEKNVSFKGNNADEYQIVVNSIDGAVNELSRNLSVDIPNKLVSIIRLSLATPVPSKGEVIVDRLIEVYLQANIDDKSRIAESTISFIDDRMKVVEAELIGIEKDIERFKSKNQLTNVTDQANELQKNASVYYNQLTQQEVQLTVLKSLEKYIVDNNKGVVPSSLMIDDPNFTALINSYNTMQLEKERQLLSTTERNPMVVNLEQRINSVRKELISSLKGYKRNLEVTITELKNRVNTLASKMGQIPLKERLYLDISRQQTIRQELYLFLLKKREETAVSKASTVANARILDLAKGGSQPISPKPMRIYMLAFSLGVALPACVLYLRMLMNNRVDSREDISSNTSIPIIGEVGHNPAADMVVVSQKSKTMLSEQFRTLRTNLQFLLTNKDKKTILLTSSMSGEGKSFVSINLACALALSGKRVICMELDLRKPQISKQLGLENNVGFSTYIIGQTTLDKIIVPSGFQDSLYIIPSGPIPPNPAELLMLPEVEDMFKQLRAQFDYIVIDTAPTGLVADALLLNHYTDVTLYLVRHQFTYMQQVKMLDDIHREGKITKLNIIVNDVKPKKHGYGYGYGYAYGYGHGYGYGYGYGENEGYFARNGKRTKKGIVGWVQEKLSTKKSL